MVVVFQASQKANQPTGTQVVVIFKASPERKQTKGDSARGKPHEALCNGQNGLRRESLDASWVLCVSLGYPRFT